MSRTSSHLRNALVSVSPTYVIMHVDDDDEAVYALPPKATNTKVHSSNAPGAYGSTTSYPTNLSINSHSSSCLSQQRRKLFRDVWLRVPCSPDTDATQQSSSHAADIDATRQWCTHRPRLHWNSHFQKLSYRFYLGLVFYIILHWINLPKHVYL